VLLVILAALRLKILIMLTKEYLIYLLTKPRINVYTYNQLIDKEGEYLKPRFLPLEEAILIFRDKYIGLVNFLNLKARK